MTSDSATPRNPMRVFYTPKMVAQSHGFSPSAAKPAPVVASWRRLGLPLEVIAPTPMSVEQLSATHDPDHVADVLAGRRANGFGNTDRHIASTFRFTNGAMLSAASYAVQHRTAVSAPCSGFHHASYLSTSGYCTFNGLVATAMALRSQGIARTVGILDCDNHYGDGTTSLIEHHRAQGWIRHFTAGDEFHRPSQVPDFVRALERALTDMEGCDVVLYQAGADPHIDDPLGGWLTTEQLRERDAQVFEGLEARRIPVAWNLAGGYQVESDGSIPRILEIHDNTARECVRVYGFHH